MIATRLPLKFNRFFRSENRFGEIYRYFLFQIPSALSSGPLPCFLRLKSAKSSAEKLIKNIGKIYKSSESSIWTLSLAEIAPLMPLASGRSLKSRAKLVILLAFSAKDKVHME